MLLPASPFATPPSREPVSAADALGIATALFQAKLGLAEGGVPIGAALVTNEGIVVGVGRNRRVQRGSATRHGEASPPSPR